ncbi:MAG: hypothetical protein KME41_05775 [Candidatus Thiodiazotropha sp. (ex Lucina pensylvanica)]|nr:hypothetical protein [Candidatus Thiodiazotropha sp. (ex Lucina pensylvanica)]
MTTTSATHQESLEKVLLLVEHDLLKTSSLLTVLKTSVFDLEATPYGEPMDPAAWSDVMSILHDRLMSIYNHVSPFCVRARARIQEETEEGES